MPFIRRSDISPAVRQRFEGEHRARLRKSLLDPSLTAAQRRAIKEELVQIGKPRAYKAGSPPRPGAITFPRGR